MGLFKKKKVKNLNTRFHEYKVNSFDQAHDIIYFDDSKEFLKFVIGRFDDMDLMIDNDGSVFTDMDGIKLVCYNFDKSVWKNDKKSN